VRSILIVAAVVAVSPAWAKGPSFEEFRYSAAEVAGVGARDCGVLHLRQTSHGALDCAKDAVSTNQPFLVIVQRRGIDSEIFSALVRAKTGEFWNLAWDSDIGGGSRTGSSLTKTRCARIVFEARLEPYDSIQCITDTR